MWWDERIHECLEVWPPPLRERITDFPFVVDALTGELGPDRREALVEPGLKAFDLVVFGL